MLPVLLSLIGVCASQRLFLIGGAANPNNTQLYSALAKSIPGRVPVPNKCPENWAVTTCPRIAVVTSAAPSQADGDEAYSIDEPNSPSYYTMFHSYGMAPLHVSAHVDNYANATDVNTPEGKTNLQMLLAADIVFFNGGDQSKHARTWLTDSGDCGTILCQLIQRYKRAEVVWAGTSAGTAIMSNPTYGEGIPFGHIYFANRAGLAPKQVSDGGVNGTGLKDTRNGTSGLQCEDNGGFVPGFPGVNSSFVLDTHFDARGRLTRLIPALKSLGRRYGLGVDEDTAFFLDGSVATVYGTNGVWLLDSSNATFHNGTYFSASGLVVSYMTAGDQLSLPTFTLSSSKPEIKTPYYTNYTDSSDITKAYECTLLVTRLVDQKPTANYGKTKIPSGYPSGTPQFQIAFRQGNQTRGYYASKKYTAEKVLVDVTYVQQPQLRL